ncbi:MAG: iron-containing alcohol dehydrogenase [Tepidisphaeraceae bacterium]
MNNFTFYAPTRLVFGKGTIGNLATLVPQNARVLLAYGGGSIRKNGVYEQVKTALAGRTVFEFGGIQPNPLYETCMKTAELGRRESVDFLLAVGGGSVLDGVKFIAAAMRLPAGDPWDILAKNAPVKSAVPLATVLTLPATGSESNSFSVMSRESTKEKLAFSSEAVIPRFAILDPQTTFTLPARQTRNGVVDAFVHVMEQYATCPVNTPLQDRQAEAILTTLVEEGPKVLANPNDYDTRANIMWCATQALNTLIGCGVVQDWATHMIGHELTALYALDHAETLAIVLPRLLRHQKKSKAAKLDQMAKRVWGVKARSQDARIETGIARIVGFFESLGMPTHLSAYQIAPPDAAGKISRRFADRGVVLGEHKDLTPDRVAAILNDC